jgi:hypothetical protein
LGGHLDIEHRRCPTRLPMVSQPFQQFSTKWLLYNTIYIILHTIYYI